MAGQAGDVRSQRSADRLAAGLLRRELRSHRLRAEPEPCTLHRPFRLLQGALVWPESFGNLRSKVIYLSSGNRYYQISRVTVLTPVEACVRACVRACVCVCVCVCVYFA